MPKRNWIRVLLALLLGVLLFGSGVSLGQRQMVKSLGAQLRAVQARFRIDKIVQERHIKALLDQGCVAVAAGELSNNELSDRDVLGEFVHERLDNSTIEYINQRDPKILDEIDTPKDSFVNTWPGCEK